VTNALNIHVINKLLTSVAHDKGNIDALNKMSQNEDLRY